MDAKPKPLSNLLAALHKKFGENLTSGASANDYHLAVKHEIRARVIQHIGVILGKRSTNLEHQKLIARYFDEIFGDMICSIYFSFSGLDNPSRILLRRALELALVTIAYWDSPSTFWGWHSNNDDVSFKDLAKLLSSAGYQKFIEVEGCKIPKVAEAVRILSDQYATLSNVVHPKPYNFETGLSHKFSFASADLEASLEILENVQISFIRLLLCRFNAIDAELKEIFPKLEELT
jgi:hypothetical protein